MAQIWQDLLDAWHDYRAKSKRFQILVAMIVGFFVISIIICASHAQ